MNKMMDNCIYSYEYLLEKYMCGTIDLKYMKISIIEIYSYLHEVDKICK